MTRQKPFLPVVLLWIIKSSDFNILRTFPCVEKFVALVLF